MRTTRLAAVLAVALIPLALTLPAHPASGTAAYPGVAADGAQVIAEQQVDARTLDITISSPATATSAAVQLLLPPGWSPSASRTWPVLYLLHGCCDTYQGWTQNTNVAEVTQGAPVIIALPDGGPVGLYSNWWNNGRGGAAWEDFTATELPQILSSGFRAGPLSAIGGVSTGGGAALFIAAHHPGQYAAAASYSGTDCTLLPASVALIKAAILRAGYDPNAAWGNPLYQLSTWQQHDPCSLAGSLRGTKLFLSVGSGLTLSGGQTSCPTGGNILESAVAPPAHTLALALSLSGIPFTEDFYSGGCHSWPYWQTAFAQSWPMLAAALGA
jgi:diacylglycerol O-acyltransferase/trehalose O-mycolyltransferase